MFDVNTAITDSVIPQGAEVILNYRTNENNVKQETRCDIALYRDLLGIILRNTPRLFLTSQTKQLNETRGSDVHTEVDAVPTKDASDMTPDPPSTPYRLTY